VEASLPPLAADAKDLLERARGEARKRGHDEVKLDHLLLALIDTSLGLGLLARRAVDARKLRAAVDARLTAVPAASTYRGAPRESRLAPALVEVFVKAAGGWRFVGGSAHAIDVAVGALRADPLAALVEEASFDVSPVERLMDAAAGVAKRRGHVNVLVDHALLAFFDEDPAFVRALRVLGHDPGAIHARLYARLAGQLRSHLLAPLTNLVELASVRANLTRTELGIGPIVVDLLRHPSVRGALKAVDVNRYNLLYAYVHGIAPVRAKLDRRDDLVDVVFHDDAYTTMEFVIEVLRGPFGLDEAEAKLKTLAVHEHGRAVVATMPRDRATAALIRAQGAAHDQRMPLRMEIDQSVELSMTKR
jgi:ATP-dependent Clp protease adaptor protein ClpS